MGSTPIERAFDRDQESDRPLGSPYAQERDDPQTRSDARDYGGGDGRADARLWYERTWSDESGGHFQDGPRLVGAASDSPIGQMFGNPKTRTIAVYDHDGGITTYTRAADAATDEGTDLPEPGNAAMIWPNPLLQLRLLAARVMIVAAVALLSACTNTGNVNWNVVQTTETPTPSPCPYGALADAPGCQPAPTPTPAPLPTGPDGKDYVPWCLPTDPPGSYCQSQP